jgi:hypothetical protein
VAKSTDEHEQLRGFSLTVLEQLGVSFSEDSLAPIRTTRSLRGLREAAHDMVEMCEDLAADQVSALDARLARDGLPTLSEMRDRRYRSLLTVLSRGRIESDDEFRLVNSCVSDVESTHLSGSTRAKASELLGAYEANR